MTRKQDHPPTTDLPPGIGKPATRALTLAGYTRLDQLTNVKEADLLKLHGVGPKAIGVLRSALQARGQALADSKPEAPSPTGEVLDSPREWVRSHIRAYVESEGKKGHRWRGLPTLLLTTRGRRTGQRRRTALIYGRDGSNFLVVPSNGGARHHPLWYLNLVEDPQVEIQVGAETLTARARIATPKEKPRLWSVMARLFPPYDRYQAKAAKAGRELPVVIVEPLP